MIELPEQSLELDMMMPVLNRALNGPSYELHCNHNNHTDDSTNEYPSAKIGLYDLLWEKDLPDDQDLSQRISDRWYGDLSELNCEANGSPVTIFTDMRGYNLLCDIPIFDYFKRLEEIEEEFKELDEGDDEVEDLVYEVEEIRKELIICGKKFLAFEEIAKSFKNYFDDYVIVFDEDGDLDYIHKEYYEDMKEENGWQLWKEGMVKKTNWVEA